MAIHVFIPTLQGVSHVQSIVQEDVDVPSVVCLDGTAQSLPISNAYYDFVKKGQGVIAKDFGHEAWRVDLSDPVEMGNSWQLGIYLAHYFHSKGELGTGEPKPGDTVIWATGAVKVNRDVEPVEGVDRKLAQSTVLFEQLQQQQIKTLGVMCEANHTLVELPSYLQAVILNSCGELNPLISELNISSNLIEKPAQQPANVNMQNGSKQKTSTQKKPQQKNQSKPKADRSKRSSSGLLALVVVAGFAISAYGLLALNSNDNYQLVDKSAIDDTQHFPPPEQGMFVDDAKNLVDKSDSAKVIAKAVLASNTSFLHTKIKRVNQNCDQAEGRQFKPNDLNHFKPQALSQLCELSIHFGDEAVSNVYLYLLDAHSFLPLLKAKIARKQIAKAQTNWTIPQPKNRSKTRKALVLGFDSTVASEELKKLNRFLAMSIENEFVNAQDVQALLGGIGYEGVNVFGLTLEQF